MKKRDLLKGHQKTKLILTILGVAVAFAAIYGVLSFFEKRSNDGVIQHGNGFSGTGPQIVYNGEEYSYKSRLKNILFMGVDTTGEVVGKEGQYLKGGQADVFFLASIDHNNEQVNFIQLDRDTMTMINAYDENGQNLGEYETQLAIAYAYGDGGKISCKNTCDAVSKLLYGVEIDDYFSVNMEAIPIINDAVGGVTVTVNDDFSQVDSSLVMGQTLTLMGEQSTNFIRPRMNVGDGNNTSRMRRHRDYLTSFKESFFTAISQNPELIAQIDEEIADYRVTTMNLEKMAGYLDNLQTYNNNEIIVPEAEADYSGELVEVRVDEAKLKDLIVNMFFEKQ